jgi:hypothetical protein
MAISALAPAITERFDRPGRQRDNRTTCTEIGENMWIKAFLFCFAVVTSSAADLQKYDYRVLATNKTSTMEKEMNEAADAGYAFQAVMGGESAFGGKEVVLVMGKLLGSEVAASKRYKLLATKKTSTMEKELQEMGAEGFDYRGQTVFESTFGGREVSVILERDAVTSAKRFQYRLLATSKTSTMQKELQEAGDAGFKLLGMTVGKTALGGNELVSILSKEEQ